MAVASDLRKVLRDGDGVTTSFPFSFRVFETGDLQVFVFDEATEISTLLNSSVYSVALSSGGAAGGTVTYPLTGSPLAADKKLLIVRSVPYLQPIALGTQSAFSSDVIMEGLDRATLQIQQLAEENARALVNDPASTTPITFAEVKEQAEIAAAAAAVVEPISADITTVAGIAANVTTVAGQSAQVTTVAGQSAQIATVAGQSAAIALVAGQSASIAALGPIATDISTVAAQPTQALPVLLNTTALMGLNTAHASTCFLGSNGNWNLAKGAFDPLDSAFWENGVVTGGITATRFASGIDAATGEAWVEYDLAGTMTGSSASFGYVSAAGSQTAGLTGETWTASARLTVVSGSVGTGARIILVESATRSGNTVTGAATISTVTRTLATDVNVRCGVQITGAASTVVAGRVRVQGLQFEKAAARTAGRYVGLTSAQARAALNVAPIAAGTVLGQTFATLLTAWTSTSANIPTDDTIPQISEGVQIGSAVTLTTTNANSFLEIELDVPCVIGASDIYPVTFAVFLGAGANALASCVVTPRGPSPNGYMTARVVARVASGAVGVKSITARFGSTSGITAFLNGSTTGRIGGGAMAVTMSVKEVM